MNRTCPIWEHSFELNRFNKSKYLVTVVYRLFKGKVASKYMDVSKLLTQNYHIVWNIVHETNVFLNYILKVYMHPLWSLKASVRIYCNWMEKCDQHSLWIIPSCVLWKKWSNLDLEQYKGNDRIYIFGWTITLTPISLLTYLFPVMLLQTMFTDKVGTANVAGKHLVLPSILNYSVFLEKSSILYICIQAEMKTIVVGK